MWCWLPACVSAVSLNGHWRLESNHTGATDWSTPARSGQMVIAGGAIQRTYARNVSTPDEVDFHSNAGTIAVDAEHVTIDIQMSSYPSLVGSQFVNRWTRDGDRLVFSDPADDFEEVWICVAKCR